MANKDLITIIIPVYNSSKYIRDTIESIENQTYTNYEAIFIDDCSTDNSRKIIEEYILKNPRFRLIKLSKKIGVARARNIGIRKAKGRYLTFLDSDDIWVKNKLEIQLKYIKENDYEFTYGSYRRINEKGTKITKAIKVKEKLNYEQALLDTRILTITAMIDLNRIPKRYCYMPNLVLEDMATWWKVLKKGYTAHAQKEVLAYYRKVKKSRSSNKMIMIKYRWKLYRKIEKLPLLKSIHCFLHYTVNATLKRLKIYRKIDVKYKDLEVLISTMNLSNNAEVKNLVNKMNITSKYLIVNQYGNTTQINDKNVINKREYGLSKSRNIAIANSNSEIILLADDDVCYNSNYDEIVINAHNKYNDADIICFYVESKNKNRRIKRMRTGKIGYLKAMRIVSFEISLKKERLLKSNLKFNENYGAGTKNLRGEETIFLYEALRKGLKVLFVNKKIGEVEQKESTWFSGYNETFFYTQGKIFKEMTPNYYKFLIIQYAVRKYFLYHKKISFARAIKKMMEGARKTQ